ncbi:hypothetical protein [Microbulbifer sp. A4B17]|nr:hypothetical protein [Microbulbifer sp. A4B17]
MTPNMATATKRIYRMERRNAERERPLGQYSGMFKNLDMKITR